MKNFFKKLEDIKISYKFATDTTHTCAKQKPKAPIFKEYATHCVFC